MDPEPRCRKPGGGAGVCPFCADAETYETVQAADLLDYARRAETLCRADFGLPSDSSRPTLLLFGLRPECIREPDDRRYDIYLQRDSDPYQLRLQIGHEMFHRVCSEGRIFHWTHEMLACLVSVRLLRRSGADAYADQIEREYEAQAAQLSFDAFQNRDLSAPPYPPGLYGRAYITGRSLLEVVGWSALCRLARALDATGNPDLRCWQKNLAPGVATAANFALSETV